MKKLLLSAVALSIVFVLGAQTSETSSVKGEMTEKLQSFGQFEKAKANQSSGWYNFMREIMNISSDMPYYRNYLFPDSTVQSEFSNGMGYVWLHSLGQVLDPTSNYFLFDARRYQRQRITR